MFNSKKEAEERMEILAYLEALLGCVKSLHASVGAVMNEVAAMRATMVSENHEQTVTPPSPLKALPGALQEELVHSYDDLVEEIAASQRYKN